MRCLIFDTGPIISLTMNNLLWLLKPLKERFNGEFYITPGVKKELIDRPLHIKRFEFEALQTLREIKKGNLKLIEDKTLKGNAEYLMDIANRCFKSRGQWLRMVQYAEMESLAAAMIINPEGVVVDERTTRMLIESPENLQKILEKKLHSKISIDRQNLKEFRKEASNIRILRSVELVTVAFELGLLDEFLADVPNPRRQLLDSVLWGVKLDGCAVSGSEIDEILKLDEKL